MLTSNDSYFSVSHHYKLYLTPYSGPVSVDALYQQLPKGMQISNELISLQHQTEQALNKIEQGKAFYDFAQLLNHKLDLVLQLLVEQEFKKQTPVTGSAFGGSYLHFASDAMVLGQNYLGIIVMDDHQIIIPTLLKITEQQDTLNQAEIIAITETNQDRLVQVSLQQQQLNIRARKSQES
ncbi:hypothetical protein [Paraferrimonas sp. SM1919]|uniref:hypothetical protein n=1 Tax=Paraferrimonas sp. SM1919 TaxID=2662263 RepID=UPI0013D26D53|nr:hypothetical protein [Paraferrimonas sp. SM1919]